ncbi:nuclear transport factor 2 family protein [Ramlibacter henchirensis]|nr:nuclear transport factor 2 family protein [Ramlibacter henchirensis]
MTTAAASAGPSSSSVLEAFADELAIRNVLLRWCRAVDRLDCAGMRAVFHPDAVDRHGPFEGTVDELIAWISERHRSVAFSSHSISNIVVDFNGRDFNGSNLAVSESYVRTIQSYPADAGSSLAQLTGQPVSGSSAGFDMFSSARYVDRFERRDGPWLIARRTVVHDWKRVVPIPQDAPRPKPQWAIGRRDSRDPLFEELREIGLLP